MNGSNFFYRWAVLSVIFVVFASFNSQAQCDPPDLLPTLDCNQAPEVCLQDACYSTTNDQLVGYQTWCGPQTIINNPQFFVFTATSTTIEIHIHVENPCSGGNAALQAGIINLVEPNCTAWQPGPPPNGDVLACNPGTPPGGTIILQFNNAEIDSQYLLLIDGSNGATCQYTISYVSGTYEPQINQELDMIDPSNATVCQGQDEFVVTVGPAIVNAHGYLWTVPFLDPEEQTTTDPEFITSIPEDAPPGTYQICAIAFSGCDTTMNPQCMEVEIVEIDDEMAPDVIICDEDLPYQWHSNVINGPGTYIESFDTPEGCPYDSILMFDVYPMPDPGLIDTVYCGIEFEYEGISYSSSDVYDLFYQDASVNGCDSTAVLDLTLAYVEFDIELDCEDQMFQLCPSIYAHEPASGVLSYKWTNSLGDIISEDECALVSAEDIYDLSITIEVEGVQCTYDAFQTFEVVHDGYLPEPPVFDMSVPQVCGGVATYSVEEAPGVITWDWTAPPSTIIFGNGSSTVDIDFSSAPAGGMVCVTATNDCGTGEETCIEVMVIEEPDASFNMPQAACVDALFTVEFTGSSSPSAILNWNFGDADVISGSGPGPYELSYPTQGTDLPITLEIIEPGCDTVTNTQVIDVEQLVPPIINCESTIDQITFTWNDNGNEYSVNQTGGPAGTLNGTTYSVTGLSPGDSVTIEVMATNNGPCGVVSSEVTCFANNCPDPGLGLELPDSICLNEVAGTYMLEATAGGDAAMGAWSGPGIINSMTGEFDPMDPSAGVGQHTIIFMYTDTAGCVSQTSGVINVFNAPSSNFQVNADACVGDIVNLSYMGSAGASAEFNWNFDGATIVSGSGDGPYQLMWNSPGNYTVSLSVEQNGCTSDVNALNVNIEPALQAINWSCSPQTNEILLTWNVDPNAVDYQVNFLFGGPCIVENGQVYCDGLMPGDSVAIELVAMSNGICPDVRDTLVCTAKQCPPITLNIDSVAPICLYPGTQTIDLDVEIINENGGSGYWTGPGILDSLTGIFDPIAAGPGLHSATFRYQEEGCNFNRSVMIEVNNPPTAVIDDQDYVLNCENQNMVTLDGTPSFPGANLVFSWSTSEGDILSGQNSPMPVVGGMGDYQLLVTDMVTGCVDSTTVFVDQDDDVPTADAGAEAELNCNIEMVTIGGASSSGQDIIYEWSTSNGSIIGSTTGMTIDVNAPGNYQIIVTDTVSGCVSMDNVDVTENIAQPEPSASVDEILDCDTESVTVTGTTVLALSSYQYLWTTDTGHIVGPAAQETIIVDEPGVYTFIVLNLDNGCSDSVDIEVLEDPEVISSLDMEFEPPLCFGDANGMVAVSEIIGGTPPFTYNWSTGSTDDMLTDVPAGTYMVTVSDANGCTDMASVDLEQPIDLSVDLGNNIFVNLGDSVVIVANPNIDLASIALFSWTGIYTEDCATCDVIIFEAENSGMVTLEITDVNGCTATASLTVDVNRPKLIYVPNVFSPNNDGINDYFTIFANQEIEEVRNMKIFDRWGDIVYSQEVLDVNNPQSGWDGHFGDKEVLPGVYVFSALVVYKDGYEEVLKGDITLIR